MDCSIHNKINPPFSRTVTYDSTRNVLRCMLGGLIKIMDVSNDLPGAPISGKRIMLRALHPSDIENILQWQGKRLDLLHYGLLRREWKEKEHSFTS